MSLTFNYEVEIGSQKLLLNGSGLEEIAWKTALNLVHMAQKQVAMSKRNHNYVREHLYQKRAMINTMKAPIRKSEYWHIQI